MMTNSLLCQSNCIITTRHCHCSPTYSSFEATEHLVRPPRCLGGDCQGERAGASCSLRQGERAACLVLSAPRWLFGCDACEGVCCHPSCLFWKPWKPCGWAAAERLNRLDPTHRTSTPYVHTSRTWVLDLTSSNVELTTSNVELTT